MNETIICPVCGKTIFAQYADYDICKFCGWENEDYFDKGGANGLSFEEYKRRYQKYIERNALYIWEKDGFPEIANENQTANENGMGSGERYQLLRPYLSGTERVLWSGNPCTTRKLKIDIAILVIMLFWIGGALFWMISSLLSAAETFDWFGIPVACVGLFMLYQSIIAPRRKLPHVVYAVTDIRAIILIPSRKGYSVTSYMFHSMQGISLADLKDKNGSIIFPSAVATTDESESSSIFEFSAAPNDRFLLIDNVNEVYTLILNQIKVEDRNI